MATSSCRCDSARHDPGKHVSVYIGANPLGDRSGERMLRDVLRFQVFAFELWRSYDQAYPLDPLLFRGLIGGGVLLEDCVRDRLQERLGRRPVAQCRAHQPPPVHREPADGFVFAGEIVVDRPGRHLGRRGDVLDQHVVQAALDGQAHRRHSDRPPGRQLLALPETGDRLAVGPALARAAIFSHNMQYTQKFVLRTFTDSAGRRAWRARVVSHFR